MALVLKPQGIRGEIKVMAHTDSAEDLCDFSRLFIDEREYKVLKVRPLGDCAYLTLKGVADRNAAELLRGKTLYALREDAPPLPEGRYYIVDLIGCKVEDETGELLGEVNDVTPARTDIYSVLTPDGKTVPFAAVSGVITSVDIEKKIIVVDRKKYEEVAILD